MRFGDYECNSLDLGNFFVDGGAAFGVIPRTEWQKLMPPDDQNRVRFKNRSLLIRGNNRNILVDTGYGNKLSPEMRKQYGIESDPMDMNLILNGYDLDVNQITDVILTHLHFDHTGGSTVKIGNQTEPAFPNALYYIQTEQWEYASNPHERDKDSYITDDFLSLESHQKLQFVDGSITLFEGIELMVTYGHTTAMQLVVIKDEQQSLFYCSDLVPTAAHIPVPWLMGYDNRPLDLFPEKDYFLRKAIRENWILFFEHDPEIAAATVKEGGKWIEIDKMVEI